MENVDQFHIEKLLFNLKSLFKESKCISEMETLLY